MLWCLNFFSCIYYQQIEKTVSHEPSFLVKFAFYASEVYFVSEVSTLSKLD